MTKPATTTQPAAAIPAQPGPGTSPTRRPDQ